MAMAKTDRISSGNELHDLAREGRWAKYKQYLDQLDEQRNPQLHMGPLRKILEEQKLEPNTPAYTKMKAFSEELGRLQESDVNARQLKAEIDKALRDADQSGGWLRKFASKSED